MALLPILDIDNPELRIDCTTVKFLPEDFGETLADMFETMIHYRGVGLSAPQVGIDKRFFIYTLDLDSTEYTTVINPVITSRKGVSVAEEGCLSYEGYTAQVARSFEITVKYFDENMKKVERTLQGWEARIFQHELDHLDGILFVDRMEAGTLKACDRGLGTPDEESTGDDAPEAITLPAASRVETAAS